MKKAKNGCAWYYVDESGDPTFYDRRGRSLLGNGSSQYLILGFVQIPNPSLARQKLLECQAEVLQNPAFQAFPSLERTARELHAKDDHAKVRDYVFNRILELDFKAQFVVARKDITIFHNNYQGNEQGFYDYLIARLFENVVHLHEQNGIVFARRYNKERRDPLRAAIQQGITRFTERCGIHPPTTVDVTAQIFEGEPCLAIIDYMLWAVQRVFTRLEWDYYERVEEKISMLRVLDHEWPLSTRRWFHRDKPLSKQKELLLMARSNGSQESKKATPLVLGL